MTNDAFQILHGGSARGARLGVLRTAHGVIQTPALLPVAPRGSVTGLAPQELTAVGAPGLLISMPELLFRLGTDRVEHLGGLHAMLGWEGPIVAAWERWPELAFDEQRHRRERADVRPRLSEQGLTLTSHVDGSSLTITAGEAVTIQESMGLDVAACLDPEQAQVPGRLRREMAGLKQAWAQGALDARTDPGLLLFGGASASGFDGQMFDGYVQPSNNDGAREPGIAGVPRNLPLLSTTGGTLLECLQAVLGGVDLVACTQPLIDARRGCLYTAHGIVDALDLAHQRAFEPLDTECVCECCTMFTRAYLHHLFAAEELLGYRLAAMHNLTWALGWMTRVQEAIRGGRPERVRKEAEGVSRRSGTSSDSGARRMRPR